MATVLNSEEFYNQWGAGLDLYSEYKAPYLEAVDKIVATELGDGLEVIDIGSGTGHRARRLSNQTHSTITCLDNSQTMIENIRQLGLPSRQGDIAAANFDTRPSGSFDRALCLWNVFGHIMPAAARSRALKNIRQILKPGGALIIDVNSRYNLKAYGPVTVIKNLVVDFFGVSQHDYMFSLGGHKSAATRVHIFNLAEMKDYLARAGFSVRSVSFVNYQDGRPETSQWTGQLVIIAQKV